MSTTLTTVLSSDAVMDAASKMGSVSGLPVLDASGKVIGVLSKRDVPEDGKGTVGDHMSSPAITLKPTKRVSDAAGLMLKHKVHRLPVVSESGELVGMVSRTDIFTALGMAS
jgi:CBS domain-containing protein